MSIDCSFVVSSFRELDAARKALQRKKEGDLLGRLGVAAVNVGWRDEFAEAFLSVTAHVLVGSEPSDDSWRGAPITAPGFVLHALSLELVLGLRTLGDRDRALIIERAAKTGLGDVRERLAILEGLATRAGDRANVYLCTHLP